MREHKENPVAANDGAFNKTFSWAAVTNNDSHSQHPAATSKPERLKAGLPGQAHLEDGGVL